MNANRTLRRSLRVLAIDDNADFCGMMEEMLRPLGAEVDTFACPVTALQVFIRKRDFFDLVLLDYYMPHLDGERTLRWLRQLDPEIKVILCSAADEERLERIVADERANAYVRKPFHCAELIRVITRTVAPEATAV